MVQKTHRASKDMGGDGFCPIRNIVYWAKTKVTKSYGRFRVKGGVFSEKDRDVCSGYLESPPTTVGGSN